MNVNKMRRHMARNTPDEIKRRFEVLDDDVQLKYEAWLRKFMKNMKIKHGKEVHVVVYMEDDMKTLGGTKIVTALVKE